MIIYPKFWGLLLLSILIACSPNQKTLALNSYEDAQKKGKLSLTIAALETLNSIEPSGYQKLLNSAKIAQNSLKLAKAQLHAGDYLSAYINSRESHSSFPIKENRNLLIKSGQKIQWLLIAQSNIDKSFEYFPTSIHDSLNQYTNTPILEWDLIATNKLIEQLSYHAKYLKAALNTIEQQNNLNLSTEILSWQLGIKKQLTLANEIQSYITNIALYRSAQKLKEDYLYLLKGSKNLLSLVRTKDAANVMKPDFIKIKKQFEPYSQVIENLSLATSIKSNNSHMTWYKNWYQLEWGVLNIISPFSNYLINETATVKLLNNHLDKNNLNKPNFHLGYINAINFNNSYPEVSDLINKLTKNKVLLNHRTI